jgi:hypothetical protein
MAHNGTWQTQKLLALGIELPRADPLLARNLSRRQIRPQALANDRALLLHGPGPTPISRAEDLPRRDMSARKTNPTSVLCLENQIRRQRIHPRTGSQNAYATPEAAVAPLTSIKAICRELRVSRKVVRKVLRSEATEFRYEREQQPMPRLGAWRDELDRLLAANEARPSRERLTLNRVFEALRGSGYEGGYDAVRRYARTWRRDQVSSFGGLTRSPESGHSFVREHEPAAPWTGTPSRRIYLLFYRHPLASFASLNLSSPTGR